MFFGCNIISILRGNGQHPQQDERLKICVTIIDNPQLITLRLLSNHHRVSTGRAQLVTLRLLSTHHPWVSWQCTAGQTSVTLPSSFVGQLAEHSWSHFDYSPLIIRGSAGRAQIITLLLLSTHHPLVNWQRNPHPVETKTINSYELKSIFYICYQIL